MNVLFLTMNVFTDIEMHNIYSDLMKEFIKHGHRPYIVTPREKKLGEKTELINYDDYSCGNDCDDDDIRQRADEVYRKRCEEFAEIIKALGEFLFNL